MSLDISFQSKCEHICKKILSKVIHVQSCNMITLFFTEHPFMSQLKTSAIVLCYKAVENTD